MVPVIDLSRRGRELAPAFAEAAASVAANGTYLLGEQTAQLESELAAWLRAEHVVAVGSGAGALQLALASLGIGPGDEVIVPAFTAVPTASAVCATGATPVMADVDGSTAALDEAAIERVRTPRTRAVVVVHLYGRPAPLPDTDLPVVEDAAQAHGALRDHGRAAAVVYSFYPTKNLGGIGDGGVVVTADARRAELIRRLRVHGMTEQYVHEHVSQNSRMAEIEAAWLRLVLPSVDSDNTRRRAIAGRYRSQAPHLRWQEPHDDHVHHLCVFRSADRAAARDTLAGLGVATAVHYPLALTQQPAFAHLSHAPCPEAAAWAGECITVPCFPHLTDGEVEQVAAALTKVDT